MLEFFKAEIDTVCFEYRYESRNVCELASKLEVIKNGLTWLKANLLSSQQRSEVQEQIDIVKNIFRKLREEN